MAAPSQYQLLAAMVIPGAKWPSNTITFSIPGAGSTWSTYAPGGEGVQGAEPFSKYYSTLSASQADTFRYYLQMWANYAPLNFVETNDRANPGDIRVAFTNTYPYGGYTYVYGRSDPTQAGDIWLSTDNKDYNFQIADPAGNDDHPSNPSATMLHEIGHALGLDHPFSDGVIPEEYLNYRYSIMSYQYVHYNNELLFFQKFGTNLSMFGGSAQIAYVTTPMVFDILAIQSIYGVNTQYKAGNDTYVFPKIHAMDSGALDGMFIQSLFDGGGIDTIDLKDHDRRSIIDLTPGAYSSIDIFTADEQRAYWHAKFPDHIAEIDVAIQSAIGFKDLYTGENNLGIAYSTIIENVEAGSGDDVIRGNAVANILNGNAGKDQIFGGDGDDRITGGAGDDLIDGGDGNDTAYYSSFSWNYSLIQNTDGTTTVKDLRSGSPDGTDNLRSIEHIVFGPTASESALRTEMSYLLRQSGSTVPLTADQQLLLTQWSAGMLSADQMVGKLAAMAGATTSVATVAYEFFTGKIPTQAGVDYLVAPAGPNPNNLNSAYYQSFNLENRYINFAVNLGKLGEGKDAFATRYGALSLFDATREAYRTIFGAAPSDDKIHVLIDGRADYFAYYGGDGANGIGTKAAMVGWLLAEAEKADLGVMARSNDAWLMDLADGSAPFAVNILDPSNGYYKADFIFTGP